MSYDYHGAWESETGHIAPIYPRKGEKYPQYSVDYTIQLLIKSGVDKEKLILGAPFYGQTYTLTRSRESLEGEGSPSAGTGDAGDITRQPGMLAYYEICSRIKNQKWQMGRDPSEKSGPYAGYKNQWVSFDDPKYLKVKAEYCMRNGLRGMAAWTVDLDDFKNVCCQGQYPLLKAINRALGRIKGSETMNDCTKPVEPVTPVAPVMTPPPEGGEWKPTTQMTQSTTWPSWTEKSTTKKTTTAWTSPRTTTTQKTTTTQRTTTTQPTTTTASTTVATTTKRRRTRTTTRIPTTTMLSTAKPEELEVPQVPPSSVIAPGGGNMAGKPCDMATDYTSHPENCNAYYRCVNGVYQIHYCAGVLEWNSQNKICDWPANTNCQANTGSAPPTVELDEEYEPSPSTTTRRPRPTKTRTSTTPRTTTTTVPTTKSTRRSTIRDPVTTRRTTLQTDSSVKPPRPSKKCENAQRYPHKDCSKFYICINRKKLAQNCPEGYHWNQAEQTCGPAEEIRCISRIKLSKLRGYYMLAKLEEDETCDGHEFIKYWGDCQHYLECVHGQIVMRDCPAGLDWNDSEKRCDWPANANCNAGDAPEDPAYEDNHDNSINSVNERPSTTRRTTTMAPTTTSTVKPVYTPLSGDFKIVCYFTNWAWYRPGIGKYTPDNIDTDLCTHVVYGFAVLDYSNLVIKTHDSWADLDNSFYTRVTELKNKGIKVTLALGGWNDSAGDKYSRLVRSQEARKRFVNHAVEFLEKYGFEGLDLDWEYPVCWQVDCKKGFPDEKEGFTALVRELSEAFKPKGLLLSTAVSPSKTVIDAGYDVPQLSRYFDWIAVMCYDYHGQWDKKTGHVAPLYYHPDDDVSFFNTNFTMHYWMEKGAPAKKLVMGMPMYGQSFQLENANNNGLNARAPGPGQAGEFTRAAGFLAYYEICDKVQNKGWTVVKDPQGRLGPYAYHGNQWVSYDDQEMLRRKSHYIRKMGFGGGMIWALDLDDFNNRCGQGHHPLMRTIREVLQAPASGNEQIPEPEPIQEIDDNEIEYYDDEVDQKPTPTTTTTARTTTRRRKTKTTTTTQRTTTTTQPTTTRRRRTRTTTTFAPTTTALAHHPEPESLEEDNEDVNIDNIETNEEDNEITDDDEDEVEGASQRDFKVVCYFTNWAWYRQEGGKFLPEDIDPDLCTHIVYGFAVLNRESLTIKTHDSWADIDNDMYGRVIKFKEKGIAVTVAIGGWNDSAGDKYSRLVRNAEARPRFIKNVMEFIEKYGFQGLDLDWEYPVCWQVDCTKGFADEKEAFTDLVAELYDAFKPKGWLLSAAVSPSKKVIDAGYEVAELAEYFDWIAVMTYDFHGQWDKKTGHISPMYQRPDDWEPTFNANFSINYWIEKGCPPHKLVMGMNMYGQSFSLADRNNNGLNAQTYGGGEAGAATRSRGFLSYYEICRNIQQKGWTVVKDLQGRMGPYGERKDTKLKIFFKINTFYILAYSRDQWVSFDDVDMIKHKSQFVQAME